MYPMDGTSWGDVQNFLYMVYWPFDAGPSQRMGTLGSCQGPNEYRCTMLFSVCCDLLSKINKYYTILNYKYLSLGNAYLACVLLKIMTIYISILVSGCVGRSPSALICPGAYNAVKTALI